MKNIGCIREIHRYPVKSFGGEQLESCEVAPYGLYGDRSYAFIDETKQGWNQYVTARNIPKMLSYKAKLIDEQAGYASPQVEVTGPTGRVHGWDEGLFEEIQALTTTKLTMKSYLPTNDEVLAVDEAHILIVTDRSLRALEQLWGSSVDPRRFRGNIVLTLQEDALEEDLWIGKTLRLGEAELQVYSKCERCSIITLDPESQARDASLLKVVHQEMKLQFGLYAKVKQIGQVRVGDQVWMID